MKLKNVALFFSLLLIISATSLFLMSRFGIFEAEKRYPVQIAETSVPELVDEVQEEEKLDPLKIIFVGDMQFDRDIRVLADRSPDGYEAVLGLELQNYLSAADIVVGNLEGPITDNESLSVGSEVGSTRNYIFTFSPEIIPILKKHHLVTNLGNNHINNFGEDGFKQTVDFLDGAGIDWFGQVPYFKEEKQSQVFVYKNENISVAFVNYNQFLGPGLNAALEDIRLWKTQADLVFVYTHWGLEYETEANAVIQAQTQKMMVAGADLIIGSHPHVIQQTESFEGKQVYYSLGNFIFDQYFSEEVQTGLVVEATIDPISKEIVLDEKEVKMSRGVTTLK
ncbi:MAG: hypothetical protein COU65_03390 [Candidatus Pacebacteria bacterium CG10_big_fil_rev_8_21_14_0_10_42_12]|nr:MAG: hypothetical protein COU65_03390 [Candidatus Pacebacteria bacterium CG10_big_fil_rev_8_21_14_0_10_42_12]